MSNRGTRPNLRKRSRIVKAIDVVLRREPSLREATLENFAKEEILALIDEAASGSDRTGCIILTAYLERLIIIVLQARIDISDPALMSLLNERDNPFPSLYSNIRFARALNLIEKDAASELDTIRRMRNSFAHTPLPIQFTTSQILKDANKLALYLNEINDIRREFPDFSDPKAKFFASFMALIHVLMAALQKIVIEARIIEAALDYCSDKPELFSRALQRKSERPHHADHQNQDETE